MSTLLFDGYFTYKLSTKSAIRQVLKTDQQYE